MADLERCPTTSPIGDSSATGRYPVVGLDEGNRLSVRVRASPPRLRPDEAGSPSEARQIDQLDEEFAHARRIGLQQGLLGSTTLDTVRLAGPLCRAPDHLPDQAELTRGSQAPIKLHSG